MSVYTICFCGTSCWPDEGAKDSKGGSDPAIYGDSGYIPVKIYNDVVAGPDQGKVIVPGAGKPWLTLKDTLWVRCTAWLSFLDEATAYSMWDLVGHAAANVIGVKDNKQSFNDLSQIAPHQGSPVKAINIVGHSRGGVQAIMAAHVFAKLLPAAQVRIFAIDPVPGTGGWDEIMTTLPANVKEYVGVYALDETSAFFNAVVPWTNTTPSADPLAPVAKPGDAAAAVAGYELIYAPGRHATVAGNRTSNGKAVATKLEDPKYDPYAAVGEAVNALARAKLHAWGTNVSLADPKQLQTAESALKDTRSPGSFATMRTANYVKSIPGLYRVARGISSTSGSNPTAWCYLEDVIGLAPLPGEGVTVNARNKGKVAWTSLADAVWPPHAH